MNRIKALGLVLLTVFAVSVVPGGAAQAGEFHSETEKTYFFGEQEGEFVFTTTAGKIKCKKFTLDSIIGHLGTFAGKQNYLFKTVVLRPEKAECTAFGLKATVDNPPAETGEPCSDHLTTTTAGANVTITSVPANPGDRECETKVTVPGGNCNVVVNQQTPGTPAVTFTNTTFGGKGAVKLTWGVKGIEYTVQGPFPGICGSPGTNTNGEWSGAVVLRGYGATPYIGANQVAIEYK
jgi:hypothetical protein